METRQTLAKDCGFPRVAQAIEFELARYAVMSQQPEKAEAYRAQLLESAASLASPRYIRPSEDTEGAGIAQARLMLHLGLLSEGSALIAKLLADAITHRRKWREAKLRILKSIALHHQGKVVEESQEIGAALDLGASMGLVRTFLDEGDAFVARLRTHAEAIPRANQNTPVARYLASLLHAADAQALAKRPLAAASFSEQESKLLDLLARGRTNRDIATALELSVNTVKWHLAHIYAKLRVHNRSQAVFIARQRGLMS
jgi:LuxR family maltose regulon positive regulatory protein